MAAPVGLDAIDHLVRQSVRTVVTLEHSFLRVALKYGASQFRVQRSACAAEAVHCAGPKPALRVLVQAEHEVRAEAAHVLRFMLHRSEGAIGGTQQQTAARRARPEVPGIVLQ